MVYAHLITVFVLVFFSGFVIYKNHVNTGKILVWTALLIGLNLFLAFDTDDQQEKLQVEQDITKHSN